MPIAGGPLNTFDKVQILLFLGITGLVMAPHFRPASRADDRYESLYLERLDDLPASKMTAGDQA